MKGMSGFIIAIISCATALLAGSRLAGPVRLVDILTLFGAGFAAGAGFVGALVRRRYDRGPVS